jgi:hypothetical protein
MAALKSTIFRTMRVLLAGGALVGAVSLAVLAQPSRAANADPTTANVEVTGQITLTGLTASFTLSGRPGQVITSIGAVTMTVTTNNFAGYAVTVQAASPNLTGAIGGNTDTVPVGALTVRATGGSAYTALSNTNPFEVVRKTSASSPTGDAVSNDYQIMIPFARPDIYTGTLNYIASTL